MVKTDSRSLRSIVAATVLFLVHSNLLISFSAASVALSTMLFADLTVEALPLFIVFAVTLFVYSFNRLTDLAEDEQNVPDRAAFIKRYGRGLFALGTILYLLATAVAIARGVPGAPAMVVPLVVAVLYSVVGIKRILLVKNLLVGISWGLIVLGVGVYYNQLFAVDILFFFVFITAVLTIAAVVFDIKDIEGDRAEGIRTVPAVVGPKRTRQFSAVAILAVGAVVFLLLVANVLHSQYLILFPFLGYILGYTLVARRDRTPIFYGFVIDVEHTLLAAILVGWELFW